MGLHGKFTVHFTQVANMLTFWTSDQLTMTKRCWYLSQSGSNAKPDKFSFRWVHL